MSRTLRRPMFRGGSVNNSYNTGITSGLGEPGYADGGRVGFKEGEGIFDFFSPEIVTEEEAKIRPDIYSYTKRDPSELLNFTPLGRLRTISKISPLSILKQAGKYPEFPVGYPSRGLPLEKAPFLTNQYFKETLRPYTSGATETLKQAGVGIKDFLKKYGIATGIGTGAAGTGYGIYKGLEGENNKPTGTGPFKTSTEEDLAFATGTEVKKPSLPPPPPKTDDNEIDIEDVLNEKKIQKEADLYAKLLGGEEARSQAIYDALLAASPAFFKGKNLREAAPEVLKAVSESKAFEKPQNIKQAAAQLAIQRRIAIETAKAKGEDQLTRLERSLASKETIGSKLKAYGLDPKEDYQGATTADANLDTLIAKKVYSIGNDLYLAVPSQQMIKDPVTGQQRLRVARLTKI